jgi:hypothetical protein
MSGGSSLRPFRPEVLRCAQDDELGRMRGVGRPRLSDHLVTL